MTEVPPPPPAGAAGSSRSTGGIIARIGLLGVAYIAGTVIATPLVLATDDKKWAPFVAIVAAAVVLGAVATPGDTAAKIRGGIIGGVVVSSAGFIAYQLVLGGWRFVRWGVTSIWDDILNGDNNDSEEGLRFPWTR